jgi:hypothetical protein
MIGDYEFWFKIARYYPMVKCPVNIYWNRLHEGQESKTDYAKRNYANLRNDVLEEALAHPDCPLHPEDLASIRKQLKMERYKTTILTGLGKLRRAISGS